MRFITIDDPNGSQLRSIRMDRLWFPARHCDRNDATGVWDCKDLAPGPASKPTAVSSTRFPNYKDPRMSALAPSLVTVTFDMPYSVSGITERNYHGTGLVVDAQRGLVVVDRNTVPVAAGDVTVTFAGTVQVPGRVVYVHPLHNFAVVAYDPKLLGTTPVKSARLSRRELVAGERVWVVGMSGDGQLLSRSTEIASIDPLELPLSRTMRFRDSNIEAAQLVNPPLDFDGVLSDASGEVLGTWSSFAYENGREIAQDNRGVPIGVIADMLDRVRTGRPLHSLEAELSEIPLSAARELGLPESWTQRLSQHDPSRRQVLSIVRLVGGSPAAGVLLPGDLVLAIDGSVVTRVPRGREGCGRQATRAGDAVARPGRGDPGGEYRRAARHGCRPPDHLGRSHAAGTAPGDEPRSAARCRRACTWATSPTAHRRRATGCTPEGASWKSMAYPRLTWTAS